jgi:DNA repair exonuclease SbcCD ATPase subunit
VMSDRSELGDKCFWNPEWAEQEIERLTAERDTAEAILERLQNKFEAVTAELADCKESDRLIERLQARVGELEAKLYRKDERIKAWKQSSDEHEARVEKLEAALDEIAANKDMTLLGCAPHNVYMETSSADEEAAHQYGANKAFNQCAATARAALKDSDE